MLSGQRVTRACATPSGGSVWWASGGWSLASIASVRTRTTRSCSRGATCPTRPVVSSLLTESFASARSAPSSPWMEDPRARALCGRTWTASRRLLSLGTLRLHLIRRGERLALRVRDTHAPALTEFGGLDRFPVDPSWRLVGRLERIEGRTVQIVDITGAVAAEATPGSVRFERGGTQFTLDALPGGDDGSLWLIFGDATNGRDTYGGGRYLYTGPVRPGGERRGRLQPRLQPAVRLLLVCHLPAATRAEPSRHPDRGGGALVRSRALKRAVNRRREALPGRGRAPRVASLRRRSHRGRAGRSTPPVACR